MTARDEATVIVVLERPGVKRVGDIPAGQPTRVGRTEGKRLVDIKGLRYVHDDDAARVQGDDNEE